MKMRSLVVSSAVLFVSLSLAAAGWVEVPDLRIVGTTDKSPLAYTVGDEVTFTISLTGVSSLPSPMKFKWNVWGDNGYAKNGEEPAEIGKPLVLKMKAEKPGSFRVFAGLVDAKGVLVRSPDSGKSRKIQWFGGAIVDSAKLPRAPEPADFDKFWSAQKARLAAEPLKVTRRQVKPAPHDNVNDCWAIDIACPGGRDLHGYLTIPKTWKDGKKFVYAEVVTCALGLHSMQRPHIGTQGICLNISASGQLVEVDEKTWKAYNEKLKGPSGRYLMYDDETNANPEKSEFLAMAFRLMRGYQFLKTLPEWTGEQLGAWGEGLQAIYVAALVDGVNFVTSAHSAFPADFSGPSFGRMGVESQPLNWRPELGYFDPVNLARRVPKTCSVNIENVYLGGYPPVPAAIDAIYRNLRGPKSIKFVQGTRPGSFQPRPEDVIEIKEK